VWSNLFELTIQEGAEGMRKSHAVLSRLAEFTSSNITVEIVSSF